MLLDGEYLLGFILYSTIRDGLNNFITLQYIGVSEINKGLGSGLLRELLKVAEEQRYCEIFVRSAFSAIGFYHKHKFWDGYLEPLTQ